MGRANKTSKKKTQTNVSVIPRGRNPLPVGSMPKYAGSAPGTTTPVTATATTAQNQSVMPETETRPRARAVVTPTLNAVPTTTMPSQTRPVIAPSVPLTQSVPITPTSPMTRTQSVPMTVGINRGLYLPSGTVSGAGGLQPIRPLVQSRQAEEEPTQIVPRERWIRDMSAQRQGPLQSGQQPGMPPYIGPYSGSSRANRVPTYLDPTTKRYTPGSPEEYRTWLSGQAFGVNTNSGEMPRFSGVTPTDLEMANVRRAQQGPGTLTNLPISNSALQSAIQSDVDRRKAWAAGMDIEDASDRARRRNTTTTLGGIGKSIADAAGGVYDTIKKGAENFARARAIEKSYGPVERIRLNRGEPSDNRVGADELPQQMPAYAGNTGGVGYGGGGGGGYGYSPSRWLPALYTWRL